MNSRKTAKKELSELLAEWQREFTIFLPKVESGRITKMAEWPGSDPDFPAWYRNTVIPAKNLFLPSVEEIFHFQKTNKGHYDIALPSFEREKHLLFGLRPCDAKAIAILDMVFDDTCQDPYYLSRRKSTLLVGLGCTSPHDSCFCTALGDSPIESPYVDIMFTDIGDEFYVEANTEAGTRLIQKSRRLKEAGKADRAKVREAKESVEKKIKRQLDTEHLDRKLSAIFDASDYWEKVSVRCISCGICTLLCPTCHCFDISDAISGDKGCRHRSPDSCSFPQYTRMPAENPRAEKWRRVRNRIYHKYKYFPMNFGIFACTGCGRCIRLCPVNWDINEILNSLTGTP